jgi:hypothetical protein
MNRLLPVIILFFTLQAHGQTAPEDNATPFAPLAGTFALKVVTTGKIDLPLIGEKTPQGHILFLLTRQWNAQKGHYTRKARMCNGTSGSIFGITTEVSQKGYQGIPPSYSTIKVDKKHENLTVKNEIFLWGMKNLPKPLTAKLPQNMAEAQRAPFNKIIYDVDRDGHPGITLKAKGFIEGELYAIQRRVTQFKGKALSPDRQVGQVSVVRESVILESTTSLVGEGPRTPAQHPDQKRSWFEAIRIDDQSSCKTVVRLHQEGAFTEKPPL